VSPRDRDNQLRLFWPAIRAAACHGRAGSGRTKRGLITRPAASGGIRGGKGVRRLGAMLGATLRSVQKPIRYFRWLDPIFEGLCGIHSALAPFVQAGMRSLVSTLRSRAASAHATSDATRWASGAVQPKCRQLARRGGAAHGSASRERLRFGVAGCAGPLGRGGYAWQSINARRLAYARRPFASATVPCRLNGFTSTVPSASTPPSFPPTTVATRGAMNYY
jgi:hypothetical protein